MARDDNDWYHDWKAFKPSRPPSRAPRRRVGKKPDQKETTGLLSIARRRRTDPTPQGTQAETGGPSLITRIKKMILKDTSIGVRELVDRLHYETGECVTPVAMSNIRAAFRHSLKLLQQTGHLKNVDI